MKRFATLGLLPLSVALCQISAPAQGFPDSGPPLPPRLERSPAPTVRREDQVIRKGLLAVSDEDVAQYQLLLSQPKTGLMRLMPRQAYDYEAYKVDKKVGMRGGGAFFSFHYRSHRYGYGSDLSFERGDLFVGFAGADYGMMTDLGDTVLEQIFVDDPRATFLLDYSPPKNEPEARAEERKFHNPVAVDGLYYQRRLRAEVNHTYLIRSIIYNRSDTLVAFRIVRKDDDDGGLTIAWKILKNFSPKELTTKGGNTVPPNPRIYNAEYSKPRH